MHPSPAVDYNDPAMVEAIVLQFQEHQQRCAEMQQRLYHGRDEVCSERVFRFLGFCCFSGRALCFVACAPLPFGAAICWLLSLLCVQTLKESVDLEVEAALRQRLKALPAFSGGSGGAFASTLSQFYTDYVEAASAPPADGTLGLLDHGSTSVRLRLLVHVTGCSCFCLCIASQFHATATIKYHAHTHK